MAPHIPLSVTHLSSSVAAFSGACIGRLAKAANLLGYTATIEANSSFNFAACFADVSGENICAPG